MLHGEEKRKDVKKTNKQKNRPPEKMVPLLTESINNSTYIQLNLFPSNESASLPFPIYPLLTVCLYFIFLPVNNTQYESYADTVLNTNVQ